MDLTLTSEQSLLRDSAAKFIAAAGPKVARKFRGCDPAFDPARLRQAGELGWLGMLVPASSDGLGLGLTELALVMEQAGRGLVSEPLCLAAIAAAALSATESARAPHPMLERAMSGAALIVPALQENGHGDDPLAPRTKATGEGGRPRLNGTKTFVCAEGAEGFLVSAISPEGPVLCLVLRGAPGCSLTPTQTVDGRDIAALHLTDTPAELVPPHPASQNAVEALHNLALMAVSAELLGVMAQAQDVTLDYLRIRKQFGKVIGSFQALQHQATNIYIRVEATRSLVYQVAANNGPYRIDPALAIAVKAKASEEALTVTQACIQLHGAIGFTDEHDIGLYLKRAMLLASLFGNAAEQRRRYVAAARLLD